MRSIGPGPAKYKLPSSIYRWDRADSAIRKPGIIIGRLTTPVSDKCGPGPARYHLQNLNQFGRPRNISLSMGQHDKESSKEKIPGSNRYKLPSLIAKKQAVKQNAPEYSMTSRPKSRYETETPGSNKYKLADTIGSEPSRVILKGPSYSMSKKTNVSKGEKSPASNQYFPKLDQKIKWSLQFKEKNNQKNEAPSSNKYNLQRFKPGKSGPSYTMRGRKPEWIMPVIVSDDN